MMKNNTISHYYHLMRLHNLTGAWLLLLPALWAIALFRVNNIQLLWCGIFFVGAVCMRAAGCIINDIIDSNIDKQVARTKERPIAAGNVTYREAIYLLCAILPIGVLILCLIGKESFLLAIIVGLVVVIYPFTKRYFHFPQIILAFIFNSGIFFGSLAVSGTISLSAILMYVGALAWTVYYDTIYAHQDKQEDKLVGVGSMALTKYGSKQWLNNFCKIALFGWGTAGALVKVNMFYYVALIIIAYFLYLQLKNVILESPSSCNKAFNANKYVGIILFIGALLGKA